MFIYTGFIISGLIKCIYLKSLSFIVCGGGHLKLYSLACHRSLDSPSIVFCRSKLTTLLGRWIDVVVERAAESDVVMVELVNVL